MYFVKYGSKYLHEPRVDGLVLTDLKFEGQENEASLCSFEIGSFHPLYDELVERASTKFVKVFDDALGEDEPYFVGYIYEISDEFDRQRTVKCKGELSFFNDSIVRPYTTQGSAEVDADPGAYFEWLVEKHNEQVEAAKQFAVGHIQASGLDLNGYILRADSTYPTTGEVVKSKLLDSIGGVLNVRYENGRRYIDYLSEWSDVNVQVFDFGVNLTDFTRTDDALDVATFVVPVGANMKDTDYDYDDGYFQTADAAPKANKEYFVRSFSKCGAMTAFQSGVTYWEKKETDYFKTSDTKPFSGVDYYCKVFTKVKITKFAAGKTYYRLIDGVYTKVTGSFNKNYTYYTMKWEKQSVSSFDSSKTYWEKETYYAKTSDSAPKSGKDYYLLKRGSYSSKTDLGRFLRYETYYEYNKANDESERKLTIEAMADIQYDSDIAKSGDMVYSESAVEKYGWIGAVYENTDLKLRDNLLDAGVLALKEAVSPATTIEVKAVDLSLLNPEFKPIRVGEYVRVRCKPHGFDSYMLCTAVKLDLNNPENSEFTLGTTFDKLSGQQNKRIKALNKTIEQVYEQAAAISDEAKAAAIQAAEDAKMAQSEAVAANDSVVLAQENIDEAVADAVDAKEAADAAQLQADKAVQDAYDAAVKAEEAKDAADEATAQVELIQTDVTEAKQAAQAAQDAAGEAAGKADDALNAAGQAAQDAADANAAAGQAQSKADEAYTAAGQAQAKVDSIEGELDSVQQDAAQLRDDLEGQIQTVTNTMTADYSKKTELSETTATLRTEIQTSAAGIRQEVSADYAKKTDLTSVQENLQTQVTQNASAIEQKASRTEVQEISEAAAKEASDKADAAQAAADAADAAAKAAQAEAEQAKSNAAASQSAANAAQAKADEAAANLATAEAELASVKGRVGATEADIASAEAAVAAAKKAAEDAQADADAAAGAASAAQSTADAAAASAKTAQDTADAAQDAADKAQGDVNALATRVVTTEAGIKNLSDSILLYAKKDEVTETLGWYYTKTQADAAIGLKADQITQSVSQTYQTKDAMSGYSTTAQMNSAIEQKASSITQTVSSTYATKTELAATDANLANNYAKKTLPDTRNDNQTPIWYITNYPKQVITEFKHTNVIGLSGENYCAMETIVPWSDASGGYPKQRATVGGKEYWRYGSSDTTWGEWNDALGIAQNAQSRVTQAETRIEQTESDISLRATKTELATVSNAAAAAQNTANTANGTANTVKNDLASNYYTKTQTEAQIKVSADAITSTVDALEETLESDYPTTSEMNSAINQKANEITQSVSATYQAKGDYPTTAQMNSAINQKADSITQTVSSTYSTKTETEAAAQGAKDYADNAASEVQASLEETNERVTASESVIEQLSDSISNMVRSGDETSLVKQDANGLFYFDIGSLEQTADAAAGGLADLLKAIGDISYEEGETLLGNLAKMESALTALGLKTEYIGQSTYEAPDGNVEPALVLGETDSDFKLLVTNKRIVFMEGSNDTTYIKDNTLVTNNVEVKEEHRQGGWVWRARPNGNLGLVWIGGDE